MGVIAEIDQTRFERVSDAAEERIVSAMLDCISRKGLANTTADDIARAAGMSRATLYRVFPGGKERAMEALVRHEVARGFERVAPGLERAENLEDLLVSGAVDAADFLLSHGALSYVLDHEPERVLPAVAKNRLPPGLAVATGFLAPYLAPLLPPGRNAAESAEFVVRLLVSYAIDPSPALDLTDPSSVRRFVRTYVLPALDPSSSITRNKES